MRTPGGRRPSLRELSGSERLTRMLRLGRGPGRPRPQVYGEDEVRAMIYGWHSGTVEPPQPADSEALAASVERTAGRERAQGGAEA